MYNWDFAPILANSDVLGMGLLNTLKLTGTALTFGVPLGLSLALLRLSRWRLLSMPAGLLVEFFRTTPPLVQLFWFFFALPILVQVEMTPFVAAAITFSIQSAAFFAEVFRAGIVSIERGQSEAALALGMSGRQAMRRVILPQAVKRMIPAFMERDEEIPVMRCPHVSGYFRQEQKSGLIGVYENTGLAEAWAPRGGHPEWDSTSELFPEDLERIAPWLERAIERMPIFGEVGLRRFVNGAIPHTPDGGPLLGPAVGLKNFWHCCGTSFGIAQGGGAGKYMAQWMVFGDADINMTEFDPRRYGPYADEDYSRDKVFLDYRMTFTTRLPGEEEPDGRPQKTSALYGKLLSAGAVYGETYGWERPKYFALDGAEEQGGYQRTNSFDAVAAEVKAVAEGVGVLDLSGFAKYDVCGPDAEAFLNRICANRMPKKLGGIGLVHPLSIQGRIYGEMTVTRFADDHFYCLSAAAAEQRDWDLLIQSKLPHENVTIRNLTIDLGVLVMNGPRSRDVLAKLTDADLTNAGFRWLSGQEITIAGIKMRALRVSYAGELGWELHPPMDDLAALYDAIWDAGQDYGIVNYGLYAANTMRMEKGYKAWGSELTNELTMIEADMPRFINFNKEDFVGKQATLDAPDRFRIVYGEVAATNVDVRGAEPCLIGENCIGLTTSGGYGHRVGKSLFFACVSLEQSAPGSTFDIYLQGERHQAVVLAGPAYDPDNAKMKV